MTATSFSAAIEAWAQKVEGAAETIFHESAQRVASDMQTPVGAGGNMPIRTGYLRASLSASTTTMPTIREGAAPADGQTYSYTGEQIALVIAGAELGETIYMGYGAAYANYVHYGANGRPGRQWVTLAAQRWGQIVSEVTAEVKSAAGL